MSLGDQLNRLSLNAPSKPVESDPVTQATLKGKAPTLGDVKNSVKVRSPVFLVELMLTYLKSLIKTLILATQSLDALPSTHLKVQTQQRISNGMCTGRRFATFKLFYRENTPSEYEPPYFRPGDPVKDKFVFTTHDKSEIPEKFSVSSRVTPHHGYYFHTMYLCNSTLTFVIESTSKYNQL